MRKLSYAGCVAALMLWAALSALGAQPSGGIWPVEGDFSDTPYGGLVDDVYSMRFALYDSEFGGMRLWPMDSEYEVHPLVIVMGGRFNVELGSQGESVTDAAAQAPVVYLQISVCKPAGFGCEGFEPLPTRIPLRSSVPLTLETPLPEGSEGDEAGYEVVDTPIGTIIEPWLLGGNAGTSPTRNFVGTTDDAPLTFRVAGRIALRLYPDTRAPNLIGGHESNGFADDAIGTFIGGGQANYVSSWFGTIAGGHSNLSGSNAFVGGGFDNRASGDFAAIASGSMNRATGSLAVVFGGQSNVASGAGAIINGGESNTAEGKYAVIAGGTSNHVGGLTAVVPNATGSYSFVAGGLGNRIHGNFSFAAGSNNSTNYDHVTLAGGFKNTATGPFAVVSGGSHNLAHSYASVIGGEQNIAENHYCAVLGGSHNAAEGSHSIVAGGSHNVASGSHSFAGGRNGVAGGDGSFVWAGDLDQTFAATSNNEFLVRATAGMFVNAGASMYNDTGLRVEIGRNDLGGARTTMTCLAGAPGNWMLENDPGVLPTSVAVSGLAHALSRYTNRYSVGVWGQAAGEQSIGVLGESTGGEGASVGVMGSSRTGYGVIGETRATTQGVAAGHFRARGTSGETYGVLAETESPEGYAIYSDGPTHVDGKLTWNPITGYVSLGPSDFLGSDFRLGFLGDNWDWSPTEMEPVPTCNHDDDAEGRTRNFFFAPVHLPHGAKLVSIGFKYKEAGLDADSWLRLGRSDFTGDFSIISLIQTPGNLTSSRADDCGNHIVDNSTGSYWISIGLDCKTTFYGVVIRYEVSTPY